MEEKSFEIIAWGIKFFFGYLYYRISLKDEDVKASVARILSATAAVGNH